MQRDEAGDLRSLAGGRAVLSALAERAGKQQTSIGTPATPTRLLHASGNPLELFLGQLGKVFDRKLADGAPNHTNIPIVALVGEYHSAARDLHRCSDIKLGIIFADGE